MSARSRLLPLLVAGVLLVARPVHADPPPPGRRVILLSDDWMLGRPSASLVPYRRVLEGARPRLAICMQLAVDADQGAIEVAATLKVGPNGEVQLVSLAPSRVSGDGALTCLLRSLRPLLFDAPGGPGSTLRVALVRGEPAPQARAPLPFTLAPTLAPGVTLGPLIMRFDAPPPPPPLRAVRLAAVALEACAKETSPPEAPSPRDANSPHAATSPRDAPSPRDAIAVDARLLVTDAGAVAAFDATSLAAESEPWLRCLAGTTWAPAKGRLSRVDLRFYVAASGEVSVAP